VVTYRRSGGVFNFSPGCASATGTMDRSLYRQLGVVNRCPALPDGTIPESGVDGLCPTGNYSPTDFDDVQAKGETWGNRSRAPDIVRELDLQGKPIEHDAPSVQDLPASIPGDRVINNRPDGDREVIDSRYEIEPTATGYRWREVVETRIYPPNVDIPPPWTDPNPPDSSTNTPPEFKGCGLPDTPPCRIDEGGTPTDPPDPPEPADLLQGAIAGLTDPQVADTQWTFAFALPTSCSVMTIGPFYTLMVDVDLCRYQPIIHDIMTVIWVGVTFWFVVGMVGATLRAT